MKMTVIKLEKYWYLYFCEMCNMDVRNIRTFERSVLVWKVINRKREEI